MIMVVIRKNGCATQMLFWTVLLKHYQAATDTNGRSLADVVEEGFWQRFRFDPAEENKARANVAQSCSTLLGSIMYYARIKATMDHFRTKKGRKICDKIAGQFYLTKEEYIAERQMWCKQDCWNAMAAEWSHPDFQKKSMRNRANRYSPKFKPHKGGSNSIATIVQKLSKKLGREVSEVEAWVHTHRGSDLEDVNTLNTEEATVCLEKYKEKAMELNGPDFDWLHSPVDVRALYQCSCGRSHGKWALFNGIVDDREVLPELKRSRASSMAAKRQRQLEEERAKKEAHEGRLAKEYAQKMSDWGEVVMSQMQRFMESLAVHTGMPAASVPNLPLPPPPPGFCVSTSQTQSPENAATSGSAVREETPDETLSRIANGVFLGHVNATSGGGNYSPPNDDFPLY
ncbi:unnamed protein product [Urochloa decumbens]|uniref:Uncharacterized protein n=1 Tax=Urochloa decumbens TaxID=240449 RepID=A0ABC9FNA0_9POAL